MLRIKHLMDAVTNTERAVAGRGAQPEELRSLRVRARAGGEVLVSATDLFTTTSFQCPRMDGPGELDVLVNPKIFNAALATLYPDDAVTLERVGGDLVVTNCTKKVVVEIAGPGEVFPSLEMPDPKAGWSEIDRRRLSDGLVALGKYASTDGARPHIASVLLERVGNVLVGTATDGHRLHRRVLTALTHPDRVPPSFLMPIASANFLARLLKSKRYENWATIGTGGAVTKGGPVEPTQLAKRQRLLVDMQWQRASVLELDALYPPVDQVIPDLAKAVHSLTLGRTSLWKTALDLLRLGKAKGERAPLGALRVTGLAAGDVTVELGLHGAWREIHSAHRLCDARLSKIPSDEKPEDHDPFIVGLNLHYLAQGAEVLHGERLRLDASSPLAPLILSTQVADPALAVIMPARL